MQRLINRLIPFIFIGIAVVAFALGIIIIAYIFLIGAFVGFILFAIAWLRQKFLASKAVTKTRPRTPRTYDSTDWRKM